jgi:hypothetical protein
MMTARPGGHSQAEDRTQPLNQHLGRSGRHSQRGLSRALQLPPGRQQALHPQHYQHLHSSTNAKPTKATKGVGRTQVHLTTKKRLIP